MNEKEFKQKRFAKLRTEIYPIVHNKQRTLDELIYMWDFFREHMEVIDAKIKIGLYAKSTEMDACIREKFLKTLIKTFEAEKK